MDPELKDYLENITRQLADIKSETVGMEKRLGGYIDTVETRLRGHIDTVETHLRGHIDTVETRLRDHIDTVETRLREHTEAVETGLLTEFWKWAKTAEMRHHQDHATVSGIDRRLTAIEDRVSDLERRQRPQG